MGDIIQRTPISDNIKHVYKMMMEDLEKKGFSGKVFLYMRKKGETVEHLNTRDLYMDSFGDYGTLDAIQLQKIIADLPLSVDKDE